MCLTINSANNKTKRYARTIKEKGGKITCYKILIREGGLYSRIRSTYQWRIGWNESDRRGKMDSRDEVGRIGYNIYNGIHVYKRRPSIDISNPYLKVVPVVCYIDDLVASNIQQAVFTRVFLRKNDYKKAT